MALRACIIEDHQRNLRIHGPRGEEPGQSWLWPIPASYPLAASMLRALVPLPHSGLSHQPHCCSPGGRLERHRNRAELGGSKGSGPPGSAGSAAGRAPDPLCTLRPGPWQLHLQFPARSKTVGSLISSRSKEQLVKGGGARSKTAHSSSHKSPHTIGIDQFDNNRRLDEGGIE